MIAHRVYQVPHEDDKPTTDEILRQRREILALHATVAELRVDNARLRSDHPTSEPEWKALKAVSHGQFSYEAARQWCADGTVIAEKRRGRWFVLVGSMIQRLEELAI